MTKKDYIIIAKCMNTAQAKLQSHAKTIQQLQFMDYYQFAIEAVLYEMLQDFPKDNPKFNWKQFKDTVYKK